MATATVPVPPEIPPEAPPDPSVGPLGSRRCNSKWILLIGASNGWPCWREVTTKQVAVFEQFPHGGGKTVFVDRPELGQPYGGDPAEVIQSLFDSVPLLESEFDPREPDILWDALERATREPGYEPLVESYVRDPHHKIKPRPPLTGLSVGHCWLSKGAAKLGVPTSAIRQYLYRHMRGDWGLNCTLADMSDLSDDQLWCPPVWGIATENQASIKAGKGLVRSVYAETSDVTHRTDEIRIVSLIGETTIIFCPTRGDV